MAPGLMDQGGLSICCGFKQNVVSLSANLSRIYQYSSLQANLCMPVLQGLSWQESTKLPDFPLPAGEAIGEAILKSLCFH